MRDAVTRVLNVNDDEATRYVLGRALRRAGFEVIEASDGKSALELAVGGRPDVILLDVNLPDINGYDVCRQLKADPRTSSISVLQISASFTSSGDRVHGLEGGADGYLAQPVQPDELVATVRALLRIRTAEEQARALSEQWQATFDAISDAVCLIDHEGTIVRWNRGMEALANGRALAGLRIGELLSALTGGGGSAVQALADPARSARFELEIGGAWYRAAADSIVDPQSRVRGGVRVFSDVSERHLLEDELRRRAEALTLADQRKDEFLAMLAHELRNPLAAISAGVQMLERRAQGGEQDAKMRALVMRQTRHLARMVDDLLDVSRITRGKIELRRAPMDLSVSVQNALNAVRPAVEARRHTLSAQIEEGITPLHADPTRIEQVMVNLLDNAAKYTPGEGRISVALSRADGFAKVVIRDTGIGIPKEAQARIFELFAQVESSLDRARGGLGIGLTLVRSLLELHGGTVQVHSEGPGTGTEVVVRLPLAPEVASQLAKPEQRNAAPAIRRVVLVEDNADAREALQDLLVDWGLEVSLAGDGEEAVRRILDERPQLALVDIGLPGINGFEVAERVRQHPDGQEAVLVAVTGYGDTATRTRATEAGFDLHLTKPVEPEALERLLASLPPRPAGPNRA